MEKFLIRYKMNRYEYLRGSKVDKDWNLIFVDAESEDLAMEKLRAVKERSEQGGDSASIHEHEIVPTI